MEECGVSNPINVEQFLSECKHYLSEHDCMFTDDFVGKSRDEYPQSFDHAKFNPKDLLPENNKELLEQVGDTRGLKVLEHRKTELEMQTAAKDNKIIDRSYKLISDGPWIHKLMNGMTSNPEKEDKVKLPDILIKVHFFKAIKNKKMRHVRAREFNVLGQSTLYSLKEKLTCPSDFICSRNFADDPDAPLDEVSKDIYKSNFFFIEGTFYNDLNDHKCIDLSEVIKVWAIERKRWVGPFQFAKMEGVKFIDLTFRLGQPYLYMHQGDCEHLIVFSDVRLVTNLDCCQLSKYPLETFRSKNRRVSCRSCRCAVKWIVFDSSLSPDNPNFYCDLCLKMLHYSENGKLIDPGIRVYHHPVWVEKLLKCNQVESNNGNASRKEQECTIEEEKDEDY